MSGPRTVRLLVVMVAALGLAAMAASAQSADTVLDVGIEGIGLTDFESFFSMPIGIRLAADWRVAELAPGLSLAAGGTIGWWMESFRDMYHFRPEPIPLMIPAGGTIGLWWEPSSSLALGVSAVIGFVIEWMPGAPPRLLFFASPGVEARWFCVPSSGVAARLGWTWVGADPIWDGLSVKLGPVVRQ